ncbi:hypothetical protein DEO72_LG11g1726 [Vigna unguiculata]|uniref:Uncharacterized protein n=1 Tax=Vigna unguiculata TaxID=3917 RepID=A0A4D6NP52_VIGUN|nr:hypothetical protein DEO72_LG11g1726 [Vigna unguiculata]
MAKQQSHRSLVDREDLTHLLPLIKLIIIAKENSHIQDNHTTNKRMLALVVDTSAHPRAMCYKCYNESIPSHTRMQPYLESLPDHIDGAPP